MTDPSRVMPAGRRYDADGVTVWYDPRRCRHAAECVKGDPQVFETGRKPWIRPDLGDPTHIAEVVRRCPTGALHYRLSGPARDADAADEPDEPPTVPTQVRTSPDGIIWIRGDLLLETAGGPIAERRAALCGCGRTENRPYCDGVCTRVAR